MSTNFRSFNAVYYYLVVLHNRFLEQELIISNILRALNETWTSKQFTLRRTFWHSVFIYTAAIICAHKFVDTIMCLHRVKSCAAFIENPTSRKYLFEGKRSAKRQRPIFNYTFYYWLTGKWMNLFSRLEVQEYSVFRNTKERLWILHNWLMIGW